MGVAELTGDGSVGARRTSELGPLKVMSMRGKGACKKEITARVATLCEAFPDRPDRLFLVGGSWRAIARVDMLRRGYPLKVLHEYRMRPKDIRATIDFIEAVDPEALRIETGTSSERMHLVPLAAQVLRVLVREMRPKEVAISSYGIREGLLYDQMSDTLRHRDPLIEAARHAETSSSRSPGFGRALYRFVEPLFPRAGKSKKRLIRAACLLHDVSWRAHPDYRAEVCFDNATRANLGGLTHAERVYLGLALLHRYKSNRMATGFDPALLDLLPETEVVEAEILGRAMRFGAMFAVENPVEHGRLRLRPKRKELTLRLLTAQGQDLFGEVTEARFNALAGAMSVKPIITGLKKSARA